MSRHCIVCGDKTDIISLPALMHSFGKFVSDNNATCLHDGTKTAHCQNRGCTKTYTEPDIGSALGHNYVNHQAKAPTCTKIGWAEYTTCSRCDYTTYKATEALGHDKVYHEAKEPTCTEYGWSEYYTCRREGCFYNTRFLLSKIAHNYGEWIEYVAPTCEEKGFWGHYLCSSCQKCFDEKKREISITINALGHDWDEWICDKAPTKRKDGSGHRECKTCHKTEECTIKRDGSCVSSILPESKKWLVFLSVLCVIPLIKRKLCTSTKK